MWYTALGSRNCWGAWFPSLPQDPSYYQELPLDYYLDTPITLMMKRHYPGRRTIIMNHHFGMFYNCAKLIGCNSCLSNHQTHSYSGWQTRVSELNSFLEDNDQHLENPEDIGSSGSAHGNAILTCNWLLYTLSPAGQGIWTKDNDQQQESQKISDQVAAHGNALCQRLSICICHM